MGEIGNFFSKLFDTSDWPARWHCGTWSDFHGWLYIISDLGVWGAYFAIPFMILYFKRQRPEVNFPGLFWLFASFILACGATHLLDALMFYWPAYRVSAILRFLTAAISWTTVFALIRILPKALLMKTAGEFKAELEERIKAQELLAQRNRDLEMVRDKMERQNTQLRDFAYVTSHNLRSPVANLQALMNLQQEAETQDEFDYLQEKVKVSVDRLSETLGQLMDVILVRTGYNTQVENVSFAAALDKAKDALQAELIKTNATIEADFSEISDVSFSTVYMESILLNLLSNSLKYRSPERAPVIRILTRKIETGAEMRFIDNGIGLDLSKHGNKVFGLMKTFHDHPEARGLGLYISRTQIELLGGSIDIDSTPGQGTQFTLNFNSPN